MQVNPTSRGMIPMPMAMSSKGAGVPDIKAVCKMAKDMAAFNIIDSFLNAKQPVPEVVTIRPLNMYQQSPGGSVQRVVQGGTAAMILQMLG